MYVEQTAVAGRDANELNTLVRSTDGGRGRASARRGDGPRRVERRGSTSRAAAAGPRL